MIILIFLFIMAIFGIAFVYNSCKGDINKTLFNGIIFILYAILVLHEVTLIKIKEIQDAITLLGIPQ